MSRSWNRRQGVTRQHESMRVRGTAPVRRIAIDNNLPRRRLMLCQADSWDRFAGQHSVYSEEHCCYCGKPIKPNAARLRTCRTSDGEWWLIPDRPLAEDEREPFGMVVLPIGPGCLRRHPEFRFAIVREVQAPLATKAVQS